MSQRTAGLLAWTLFAASSAANLVGLGLLAVVPARALERLGDSVLLSGAFVLVLLVFGLVGAVVAARLPGNPIGWLFLALASLQGATELTYGLAHYSTAVSTLPGEAWLAWFASWSSVVAPVILGVACLLYPDGRFVSPRWRWGAAVCVVAILPVVAQSALVRGPFAEFPAVDNPAGLAALDRLADIPTEVCFVIVLAVGAWAVVRRFRRSRGVERAQLKWFAWSAGVMTAFLPVSGAIGALADAPDTGRASTIAGLLFAVVLCGLPVAVGISILRYRLYDIDLVINRTLVYSALSATLVATYLGSVLVFRLALDPLTNDSDLVVAASTLGVAALFRPLRSRIQQVVDRRFYRSRYDAARTLEGFSSRLREEVDLDALGGDLRHVVRDTMQPVHITLWLRETST